MFSHPPINYRRIYSIPAIFFWTFLSSFICIGIINSSTEDPSLKQSIIPFFILCVVILDGFLLKNNLLAARNKRHKNIAYKKVSLSAVRNTHLGEWLKSDSGDMSYDRAELFRLDTRSDNQVSQLELTFFYTRGSYEWPRFGSSKLYYTIIERPLSRALPHAYFKSTVHNSRLANFSHYKRQSIRLEGGFDQHYTMYAPLDYTIDTMSYISPEVMEKILACRGYDIEIRDSRVIVYGPLLTATQLAELEENLIQLAHALEDNIDTYKDSYATVEEQRTKFSKRLLQNPLDMRMFIIYLLIGLGYAWLIGAAYLPPILAFVQAPSILSEYIAADPVGHSFEILKFALFFPICILLIWALTIGQTQIARKKANQNNRKIISFRKKSRRNTTSAHANKTPKR